MKKNRITALIIAAAILLTGCGSSTESSSAVSSGSSSASTSQITGTTSGDTGSTSSESAPAEVTAATVTSSEVEEATELPAEETYEPTAEPAETVDNAGSTVPTEDVTEPTAESTALPEETAEPSDTTASSAKTETPEVTSTPAETTPAETTTTAQPAEEEPKEQPQITLSEAGEAALTSYGIDPEKREQFYQKLDRRAEIPAIHITTKDNEKILSIENYTECLVDVLSCDEKHRIETASAGIRVRGNSTAYYGDESQISRNLVPYRIKFNEKTNMLGLNDGAECKSWVLLKSNWNLIMDYTAFNLAKAIFDDEYYSSDCQFVHLYVNERFVGVYLLCEQNQVNKNRVDIYEPEEGYTGTDIGYFVEIDNYADPEDKPCFNVDYLGATVTDVMGETRQFVPADYSIDSDIYSNEQQEFISAYINNVFKILYEATEKGNYLTLDKDYKLIDANDRFDNPKDCIAAVMDLKSVVNMYILYEICHDYDCGEGSFYMAVDCSPSSEMKKLTFTAPWDFNWAYNDSATRIYYAGAFNQMGFVNQYGDRTNPWFVLFMTEDWFKDMVSEKWAECYTDGDIPNVIKGIGSFMERYETDLNRTERWATENGYKLLDWVKQRCRWLDKEFTS